MKLKKVLLAVCSVLCLGVAGTALSGCSFLDTFMSGNGSVGGVVGGSDSIFDDGSTGGSNGNSENNSGGSSSGGVDNPVEDDERIGTEGLVYELSADGTHYIVTDYEGTDTDVVIPKNYEGKPVTSIGDGAFERCSGLTSVLIPDSMTSIGYSAFRECSSLMDIAVSENNTAYKDIDGNLYTKDGTTLIQYAIGKTATEFVIPDSVTSIGGDAFWGCSSLTSVEIPDSVTSIGGSTFWNCSSLTSVVIPDSVTSIGNFAFYNCSSLTSVVIGDSVTSISHSAFYQCYILTSVVIPDSVTSIGERAFYDCRSLTSVVIPDGVTSIGNFAFYNCSRLTIYCEAESQPSGWDWIWNYFGFDSSCPVVWDSNNNDIATDGYIYTVVNDVRYRLKDSEATVVTQSVAIKEAVIESAINYSGKSYSVTSIGDCAFEGCSSLTSVVIPDSVTSIGDCAFQYCGGLTSVVIPDSVTSIGERAFYDCRSLTIYCEAESRLEGWDADWNIKKNPVVWDSNNNDIATDGYTYTVVNDVRYRLKDSEAIVEKQSWKIKEAVIESAINYSGKSYSVTSIGNSAFYDCGALTSVIIPDSVTSIGERAFYNCSSLTSVVIGDGVTSIGDGAFYQCSSLTSVVIPDSVTSIGDEAFWGCSSLTNIYITDIGAWCGISGLSNVMCYGASHKKVYVNNEILTSVVIPDGVTSIGSAAFYECSSLTNVVIPDSVTSIGSGAFMYCNSLTSVVIGDSVTSIGDDAFSGCSSLTSVKFKNPNGWKYHTNNSSWETISSRSLSDASTAATYLTNKYYDYDWKRS